MSADPETTRVVRSWLTEGVTELPDRVLDAVLDQLPATQQRRATWWPARRIPLMNNVMRIALASAAVVAAALIGYGAMLAGREAGDGVVGRPVTASPTTTATAMSFDAHEGGRLMPGTYFITVSGHRVTFEVPDGWQKNVVPRVMWTPGSAARVSVGTLDSINADPCRPEDGVVDPPLGPTAGDLAAALVGIPGVDGTSREVDVGGYRGYLVSLTVPETFERCVDGSGGALLAGEQPLEPGRHRFWIVDAGDERIVVGAVDRLGALPEQVAEIEEIVASVRIEAP